ncbi:hypothetical protein [Abyssisolibacter fermentans]|uniref:hypothetical protein n=1 Tax=Abyssisolibacter fermentans TaxID=1766203 RepID=UPI000829A24B|nr:hypothetical protein [Abyssisolibacter fermentans]
MEEKIVLSSKKPKLNKIMQGILLLLAIGITVILSWKLSVSQMDKLLKNTEWNNLGFEYIASFSKVIFMTFIYFIAVIIVYAITGVYSKIKNLDTKTIGLKRTYSTFLLIILMSILVPLLLGTLISSDHLISIGNSYDVVLTQLLEYNDFTMGLDLFTKNINIQSDTINFILKTINFFTVLAFIYLLNRLKLLGITNKSYVWIQALVFIFIVWALSHINILSFVTWVN